MLISTWKLAKIEAVTPQTIRRWVKEGKYKEVITTSGGHIRVRIKTKERRFIYVSVSSAKQKTSLENQIRLLEEKYKGYQVISDIASAFNFQRKGLKTILESAMRGESVTVMVTTPDRLARSGFELIGFITSFCDSHYGERSAKRKREIHSLKKD